MRHVLSLISCFLPQEMYHVYRQVANLQNFNSHVVTRSRKNIETFPFQNITLLKKSKIRFFKRFYSRITRSPVLFSNNEVNQILKINESLRGAILHVYQGDVAIRALPLIKKFPGPRVVSFHGADLSNKILSSYRELWQNAEIFLCRCRPFTEKLIELGCPPSKIRLNHTGVPIPLTFKSSNDFEGSTFKILQVCRLIEKKGVDTTIQAVKLIASSGIDVHLTIAGGGPLFQSLQELVRNLNLSHHVRFLGFIETKKLEEHFLNAHLFCHPSRCTDSGDREGIPNSMVEAMSFGLPVVTTDHSGIPELVEHGKNGIILKTGMPNELAESIMHFALKRERLAIMGMNGRKLVTGKFSLSSCVKHLEESYNQALIRRDGSQ